MWNKQLQLSTIEFLLLITCSSAVKHSVHYLQPGSVEIYRPQISSSNNLQIYCYNGQPKYVTNIWQTVFVNLSIDTNDFVQYDGATPEDVEKEYDAHRTSWSFNIFTTKSKKPSFDPFRKSCIGIDATAPYKIKLHLIRIDYWKVLMLILGIMCFLYAPRLSNNPLFYYICGISLGISGSFLILIYVVSKIFPKKPMMYGFIVGGWTIGVYLIQLLWENMRNIFMNHQTYVIYYITGAGVISFAVCYRLGPPTNKRSKNLIKWALMSVGLLMIFCSSQLQEAAISIIIILLITYNIPKVWIKKLQTFLRFRFPPKAKLLSNDEYYEQGVKETNKALDELRTFCSSPQCKHWQTVLKLQDVKRFAAFIEGSSHLSDDELMEYDQELSSGRRNDLTDDSSSSNE